MNANLDKFCFLVKDILRNYGKQQTAEGTMTAEVIMEYLIFLKFFEPYSPTLHGEKRLNVFDKMIEQYPYIKTFNSFMEPYMTKKGSEDKLITQTDKDSILEAEATLHDCISKCEPTSKIFSGTKSLLEMIAFDECTVKLLEALYQVDFKLDDVGDIHEYFIQDEAKQKSKMYGQFFTPNEICMKAIDIVKPRLRSDGSMPDCLDPAAGSFKFMRNLARKLAQDTNTPYGNILLNNCSGCEIENKAYKALQYNILMDTGDISDHVYNANSLKYLMYGKNCKDDSFTNLPDYDTSKRYDYIFANPPFGCKAEVDMYVKEYIVKPAKGKTKEKREAVHDYMMKTRNSDGMFIQLIIRLLKDGGEACVVLCGSIFNKDLSALRKYLLETCNLMSITICPKDMFKNTSIETYLFHFKKGEPTKEIIYYNFDGTEIGRRVAFGDGFDFSVPKHVNNEEDGMLYERKALTELCFINKFKADRDAHDSFNYVELSSILECSVQPTTLVKDKLPSRAQLKANNGDILLGSVRPNLKKHAYVTESVYSDNLIISTGFFVLTPNENVNGKFLYHSIMTDEFANMCCQFGDKKAAYPSINKDDLSKLSIVVPPIDVQNEIARKLEALDRNIELTQAKIEADKEYMKMLLEVDTIGCEKVRFDDVCAFHNGVTRTMDDTLANGEYPLFSSSLKASKFIDTYDYDEESLIINTINAEGNTHIHISSQFSRTSNTLMFRTKDNNILQNKYLFYWMNFNKKDVQEKYTGTTKKKLGKQDLSTLMVTLPSVDVQRKIVAVLDKIEQATFDALHQIEQVKDLKKRILHAQLS